MKILMFFAAVSLIMGGGETFRGMTKGRNKKISFVTKVTLKPVELFDLCSVVIHHYKS